MILFITGATGSGKSKLAQKFARQLNGEIINADTRAFYKSLDTATAKPTKTEQQKYRYHLVDIAKPDQTVTLGKYVDLAKTKINEIQARGRIPIVEGGTILYVFALAYDYQIPKVAPDKKLRLKLERQSELDLYKQLIKLDPETAAVIDRHNKRRLVRALEVVISTGKSFQSFRTPKKLGKNKIILATDLQKDELFDRIEKRAKKLFNKKLEREVKKLTASYDFSLPAFSAIGYREMKNYLEKKLTRSEALSLVIKNTKSLAKRQLVWLKNNKDIVKI